MIKYDSVEGIVELLSRVQGLPFVASGLTFEILSENIYGARIAACNRGNDAACYSFVRLSDNTDIICDIGIMHYDKATREILYERLMGYIDKNERYYCYE